MPPDDSNSLSFDPDKPDLSSVPLPEPVPLKTSHAPTGGTLGDVANDMAEDSGAGLSSSNANQTDNKKRDDLNKKNASANLNDSSDAGLNKKKIKLSKKVISIAITGLAVLALAIILIALFLKQGNDGPGSNGNTGSLFDEKTFFIPKDAKQDRYALYSGGKVGEFEYEMTSNFIDGYALVIKDSQYGIIDKNGNATVEFGKYDTIFTYGGLYGASVSGKNYLIDGKGRIIREYTDQFKDYESIETSKRAAYTIFREGGKKYSIYSARGEKLANFESEETPIISSTNMIDSKSTTAVVYAGGIYIYDDECQEKWHLERNIAKKYLINDASTDRKFIILSTGVERIQINYSEESLPSNIIPYRIPEDNRESAVIADGKMTEYDKAICPGVVYETHFSHSNSGFLVCIRKVNDLKNGHLYIDEKGKLTNYIVDGSVYSNTIMPLDYRNYAVKDSSSTIAIYSNGEKKTSFKLSQDSNKAISYNAINSFAGIYIIQRTEENSENRKNQIDFYDANGEKVCSLANDVFLVTATLGANDNSYKLSGYNIGLSRSGIGIATLSGTNDLVVINNHCEQVGKETYYTHSGGLWGDYLYMRYKPGSGGRYIGKEGDISGADEIFVRGLNGVLACEGMSDVAYNSKCSEYYYYVDTLKANRELLYYGKRTGIRLGQNYRIFSTDNCLIVIDTDIVANTTETTVLNNDGEIIYQNKEKTTY